MLQEIKFHLSHDAYERFSELIAPHGVSIRDTSLVISENLETHKIESELRSGFLIHQDREFAYEREKKFLDLDHSGLPPEVISACSFRDGVLSIQTYDHDPAALELLLSVLRPLFPDPPQLPVSAKSIFNYKRYRFFTRLGCLTLLVIFALLCFFSVYGIVSFINL